VHTAADSGLRGAFESSTSPRAAGEPASGQASSHRSHISPLAEPATVTAATRPFRDILLASVSCLNTAFPQVSPWSRRRR
jgi:hypothetical protein